MKKKIRINIPVDIEHKLGAEVWIKVAKNKYKNGAYVKDKSKIVKAKVISFSVRALVQSAKKITPHIDYTIDILKHGHYTVNSYYISSTKQQAKKTLVYGIY